ncbi:hypothetical protein Pmani_035290 [Petrolisthes manimaculis]|uniref:Uncharacterized protein n=1 Tax=Petrolisthes manimaculis TaxID=1843537 RepID=A0AAE1NMN5_9EUCA|nr:hypothetical protein Pmani_035290 [Petrolisthes manimaculis]
MLCSRPVCQPSASTQERRIIRRDWQLPPPDLSLAKAAAQGLIESEDTVSQQLPDTPLLLGLNHSQSSQRKATATSRP